MYRCVSQMETKIVFDLKNAATTPQPKTEHDCGLAVTHANRHTDNPQQYCDREGMRGREDAGARML